MDMRQMQSESQNIKGLSKHIKNNHINELPLEKINEVIKNFTSKFNNKDPPRIEVQMQIWKEEFFEEEEEEKINLPLHKKGRGRPPKKRDSNI